MAANILLAVGTCPSNPSGVTPDGLLGACRPPAEYWPPYAPAPLGRLDENGMGIDERGAPAQHLDVVAGQRIAHHAHFALDDPADMPDQLLHRGRVLARSVAALRPG